jgi:hypothetical protein
MWFRKAAEQGDVVAQFNLGLMYEHGQGVPQDYVQAVAWYRKAADQGNAEAQNNLGLMYYNGRGVPRDDVAAHRWLNLAASRASVSATRNLAAAKSRNLVAAKMTQCSILSGKPCAPLSDLKPMVQTDQVSFPTVSQSPDAKCGDHMDRQCTDEEISAVMGRMREAWDEASDNTRLVCADSKTDLELFKCLMTR